MRYKPNFSDAHEFSIMSKGCRETRHPFAMPQKGESHDEPSPNA